LKLDDLLSPEAGVKGERYERLEPKFLLDQAVQLPGCSELVLLPAEGMKQLMQLLLVDDLTDHVLLGVRQADS